MLDVPLFDPEQPQECPGLTEVIERGTPPLIELLPYIAASPVRCAFCAHHQQHRKGWIVETGDGRRAMCGIDCARNHLGEEMLRRMRTGIARLAQRMRHERVLQPVSAGVPTVIAEIERSLPIERALDSCMSQLAAIDREIRLAAMITEAGTIERETWREFEVEVPRANGTIGKRLDRERRVLGRVSGASVIQMQPSPLLRAAGRLKKIERALQTPRSKISDADLGRLSRERTEAIRLLEEAVLRFDRARQFLTKDAWKEISRILRDRDEFGPQIEWRDKGIVLHPVPYDHFDRFPIVVKFPSLDDAPTLDDLVLPLRVSPAI